jgi:hypothetical protein
MKNSGSGINLFIAAASGSHLGVFMAGALNEDLKQMRMGKPLDFSNKNRHNNDGTILCLSIAELFKKLLTGIGNSSEESCEKTNLCECEV